MSAVSLKVFGREEAGISSGLIHFNEFNPGKSLA